MFWGMSKQKRAETSTNISQAALSALAKNNPPPQEWFDEDYGDSLPEGCQDDSGGEHIGILSGIVGGNIETGSADDGIVAGDFTLGDVQREVLKRLNSLRDDLYHQRDSLPPPPDHVKKETGGVFKMIEDIEAAIDLVERI